MSIAAKPWTSTDPPKRILAIRLQAMGDVVITLPYLQHLRASIPAHIHLDMLTRKEVESVPRSILLFDKVFSIGGGRNGKLQFLDSLRLLPALMLRRYDLVIDLQNNFISRMVRRCIAPNAWAEFDKYSPLSAGERNRLTIEAVGLVRNDMNCNFRFSESEHGLHILRQAGWREESKMIILNPAGFFSTRNWPMNSYIAFAKLWLERFPASQFAVLGTKFIDKKACILQDALGNRLLNLVGKTSPSEAFAIIQKAALMVSEDSGLMHMSWVSGISTITIFGSTRSDWSQPLGSHSYFFDSSDLPCGNCMSEICIMQDLRCLTRVTPEMVVDKATTLIK